MSLIKRRLQKLEERHGGPLSSDRMHLALVRRGQTLAEARAAIAAGEFSPGDEICFVRLVRPGDVIEKPSVH